MTFDTGVSRYITGTATVKAYFPVDSKGNMDVTCEQCRFYNMRSVRCNLNDEICNYPKRGIGFACPLEFHEE